MAIVFIKKPNEGSFIPYGNNIIYELKDDSTAEVRFLDVSIGGQALTYYPSPTGNFFLNLKGIVSALVENSYFFDLDDYDKILFKSAVTFSTKDASGAVVSTHTTSELIFIPMVLDYLSNNVVATTTTLKLSEDKIVKFGDLPLFAYYIQNKVARKINATNQLVVEVESRENDCGTYVKFLNRKGGYSYWLFSEADVSENIASGELLNNDFYEVSSATNPLLNSGRTTKEVHTCKTDNLKSWENEIVRDIFTSPRVYLYEREINNWIEILVTNTSVVTKSSKGRNVDYVLTFLKPTAQSLGL